MTPRGGGEQQTHKTPDEKPATEALLVPTQGAKDLLVDRHKERPDPFSRSSLIGQLPSPLTEVPVEKNGLGGVSERVRPVSSATLRPALFPSGSTARPAEPATCLATEIAG